MLVLNGYDNSNGDALQIIVPDLENITVYNTSSQDVTQYLVTNNILIEGSIPIIEPFKHGWVSAYSNALAREATETYIAMSEAKRAGETPIFFARVIDSATQAPLTQSDVSSVVYSIYRYSQASVRSGGSGLTPIDNWNNLSISVSDCFLNTPVSGDPRTDIEYNFRFEPSTLTENPFASAGNYAIRFTITPASGNRIPIVYELTLS